MEVGEGEEVTEGGWQWSKAMGERVKSEVAGEREKGERGREKRKEDVERK